MAKDIGTHLAALSYCNEPCRVCGETLKREDIPAMVFAGYSRGNGSRAAHGPCWDAKVPRGQWKYPHDEPAPPIRTVAPRIRASQREWPYLTEDLDQLRFILSLLLDGAEASGDDRTVTITADQADDLRGLLGRLG